MALNDIGLFLVEPFEESVGTLQQKYLPQLSFPPISTDTNLNSLAVSSPTLYGTVLTRRNSQRSNTTQSSTKPNPPSFPPQPMISLLYCTTGRPDSMLSSNYINSVI